MTIRSALMRAFFGLVFGAVVVTAVLSFYEFRRTLQLEIANNLQFGAGTVMQRIDTFLFSQLENIRIWRKLEVMQDIRVSDVDKRLSHFLSDLHAGQGTIYQVLLASDEKEQVVAASDARYIGMPAPRIAKWQRIAGVGFDALQIAPFHAEKDKVLVLRATLPNAFGNGTIGYLYALLDWRAVQAVLDKAVVGGSRGVLLTDGEGQVIAASQSLRERFALSRLDLHGWVTPSHGVTSYIHAGDSLGESALLVGAASASGYQHFKGLGWHIFMVEPTRVAFRPVWRLMWAMLGVLLLTLGSGAWIASRLSARIASPIIELTAFTRRFRRGDETPPLEPATAISEVGELYRAYVEMIAALERSREQIVRAGKLAVVGEMAATMAHEVRTPLGIVRSSAQLLERQTDLGENERELIGFIVSETERLNRLVTMLLECARPKPPDFKVHDLHAIIDNVLNLLAAKAEKGGVQLLREFDAEEAIFRCDREQMMQVFLNLVLNALQFVHDGGKVVVRTQRQDGALWVSVADDGPGIAEPMRKNVFDPFFSRREGGIGLGLTIVQQIVQVHGGEIVVADSPWGGAAFNMRFEV